MASGSNCQLYGRWAPHGLCVRISVQLGTCPTPRRGGRAAWRLRPPTLMGDAGPAGDGGRAASRRRRHRCRRRLCRRGGGGGRRGGRRRRCPPSPTASMRTPPAYRHATAVHTREHLCAHPGRPHPSPPHMSLSIEGGLGAPFSPPSPLLELSEGLRTHPRRTRRAAATCVPQAASAARG